MLVFSVGLQLSGFFVAVSSGLWLSKVAHGNFRALSHHAGLYIASFAVILAVCSRSAFPHTSMNAKRSLYLGRDSMAHRGTFFALFLLAIGPSRVLQGWVCVRRECKMRFWMFAVLSAGLLSISGVMFGSDGQYLTVSARGIRRLTSDCPQLTGPSSSRGASLLQ